MRERKSEDDDMLITHLPAPPKEIDGGDARDGQLVEAPGLDPLSASLATIEDPEERARVLAAIQARQGNRRIQRIVDGSSAGEES